MFTDGVVGMAGQLIAAVLETAGLYGQSQVLSNFAPVFSALGSIVYIWCIIGAIISFALFGNYRQASYLIMGPALFWWMLTTTQSVTATANIFGDREGHTPEQQINRLEQSTSPGQYQQQAQVSQFFVLYDNFVSATVQELVRFLVDTANKEDMIYVARERVLTRVARAKASEPAFIELMNISLIGECARSLYLSLELGRPPLSNAAPGSADEVERQRKLTEFNQIKSRPVDLSPDIRAYLAAIGHPLPADTFPTCEQLWASTRTACHLYAERLLQPTPEELADTSIDWIRVYADVKALLKPDSGAPDSKAIEVLAAFLLRNSIASTAHGKLTSQMAGHGTWHEHQKFQTFGTVASGAMAGVRISIVYFAGSVPYIQGLLLYVLTCAFPFFTIFLLMPGRATSFFVWMTLWLWVKSWDVGFAFVAFMRDIFWKMMPQAGAVREADHFHELNWDDPATVFNVVHLNDPTSHLNTYYTVIGILTLAVPLVTAHLCLGASNLWNSLKGGIDANANRFQNEKANGAMRHYSTLKHAEIRNSINDQKLAAAQRALANPGYTKDGVYRGTHLLRGGAMDGTAARHARGSALQEEFEAKFSQENLERRADLAMYTGRRMDWGHGAASGPIDAALNTKNEESVTDNAWNRSLIPGLSSDKAVDASNSTEIDKSSGSYTGQTDADG